MRAKQASRHGRDGQLPADKPEWIRVGDVERIFGIGRSAVYRLISEGRIKTASLSSDPKKKATRLINYASVASYLEQLWSEQRADARLKQDADG